MELIIPIIVIIIAVALVIYSEKRVSNAKAEAASRINEAKAEADQRINELKTEADQRINEVKAEADKRISELKNEAAKRLTEIKEEGQKIIDATNSEAAKRINEAKNDATARIQDINSNAEERIASQKADYEQRLTEQKASAEKELEQKQQFFSNELKLAREEMRAQFEREMASRTDMLKQEAQERMEGLKKANSEQMGNIVNPLKQELEQLRKLVDDNKTEQTKNTSALEASIKAVFEHDKERDKTTQSLAEALKNRGKVQGDWGEIVLENILRDSGLREGEEFSKQYNVKNEAGDNVRPDVIVKGADGSRIIIDSKVSLSAYTDYVGAETDDERIAATKANYDSIWQHVNELAEKQYHKDVEKAMPIVLMFVPNEGSYILAMNKDPQLGSKAYKKGVLIINPTNLMVVLKLMFLTWQNTRQEKNNREILSAASKIYDKYCTFAESYVTLGNQLTTARSTYEKGLGQIKEGKGNLSKQLQDLLQYGVTSTKQIPEKMQSLTNESDD